MELACLALFTRWATATAPQATGETSKLWSPTFPHLVFNFRIACGRQCHSDWCWVSTKTSSQTFHKSNISQIPMKTSCLEAPHNRLDLHWIGLAPAKRLRCVSLNRACVGYMFGTGSTGPTDTGPQGPENDCSFERRFFLSLSINLRSRNQIWDYATQLLNHTFKQLVFPNNLPHVGQVNAGLDTA